MPKKRATKKRGGEKPPLTEEEKMFARKGVQYTQVRSAKPGKQQLSDEAFKKEIKQNDEEAKIAKINAQLAKKPRIPKRKEGPEKENLPTKRQRTGEPAEKADEPPAKKADEPPKKVKNMDEFMKKLGTVSGETVMKQPKKEGKQDRPDPHEKEKKVAPKK